MVLPRDAQPHLRAMDEHLHRFRDDLEGRSLLALAADLRGVAAAASAAADELALAGLLARRAAASPTPPATKEA